MCHKEFLEVHDVLQDSLLCCDSSEFKRSEEGGSTGASVLKKAGMNKKVLLLSQLAVLL